MKTVDLFSDGTTPVTGATFSDCRRYRYTLMRQWRSGAHMTFIMLNPSTADEVENDPTVERCERRARAMGFGGLRVANIFALRSTDPGMLYVDVDPIGKDNDAAILESAAGAGVVVCAWGKHGAFMDRGQQVAALLLRNRIDPHVLKLNKDGSPAHPLYIPYSTTPTPWRAA